MSIDPTVLAIGLGLKGDEAATYAADRLKATAKETVLVSDDDLVALIAKHKSMTLAQIGAALNTMDSTGLLMQLQRLATSTRRRPQRVWRYRDRWYVKGAK